MTDPIAEIIGAIPHGKPERRRAHVLNRLRLLGEDLAAHVVKAQQAKQMTSAARRADAEHWLSKNIEAIRKSFEDGSIPETACAPDEAAGVVSAAFWERLAAVSLSCGVE